MKMARSLPIGISDFKEIIEGDYAYVDKTLLIQELLDKRTKVSLIPRLRRFGKTLNLSMLRYFFEKSKQDRSYLFHSLKIWKETAYQGFQGKFPVIFLTLKDIKHSTWEDTLQSFRTVIANEFERHNYLLEGDSLTTSEKDLFHLLRNPLTEEANQTLYESSLLHLMKWLHSYHKQRVVLLIDEYDTPAHAAFLGGYYNSLISFLRNWLSSALKDNPYLELGVLTGILRIAKESIFSGLNNIITFTILDETFQDKFGLLENEVKELLEENHLSDQLEEMRQWYNGYRIGTCTGIYNPWSILSCIAKKGSLAPYWVNTSENALMKQLIIEGNDNFKADLEELLKGGVIETSIEDGIVFSDLKTNPETVWSLLLFSGYLTLDAPYSYGTPCRLRIPNKEITELYNSTVLEWFKKSIHDSKYRQLLKSLIEGDVDTFSQIFQEFLLSSVSVFDLDANEPEKMYHAFVLGLLLGLRGRYEVKSNRESGYGRYDVMLIPNDPKDLGIIMEFKKIGPFDKSTLEEGVVGALKQIEEKHYVQEMQDRNVRRILYLGLAFKGKQVLIREQWVG
jgi:Predicted AAA-ATPase/PD-(D/E)XK nuclease superfamily